MPSQENPGFVGFLITGLGLLAVVLVIAGAATDRWILVPGSDSVVKTKAKFLEATNTSIEVMQQAWPAMQIQYNEAAAQIPVIMTQITQLQTMIATAGDNAPPGLVTNVGLAQAGLVEIYTALGHLSALNASLNAVAVMDKLDTRGGFLSMCSFMPAADTFLCGPPSEFRDEELDMTCEPDYVSPNQTIPTKESILEETRCCNANGLSKAMMGGKMMFFILPIIFAVLLFVPIGLMGVMSFMPGKRGAPFSGTIVGSVFFGLGVTLLVLAILFSVLIVGAYSKKGMEKTGTGLSWILVLAGAAVAMVAGIASWVVRPSAVQPDQL